MFALNFLFLLLCFVCAVLCSSVLQEHGMKGVLLKSSLSVVAVGCVNTAFFPLPVD